MIRKTECSDLEISKAKTQNKLLRTEWEITHCRSQKKLAGKVSGTEKKRLLIIRLIQLRVTRGGWSLSQRSLGERHSTPWMGRQSITGP